MKPPPGGKTQPGAYAVWPAPCGKPERAGQSLTPRMKMTVPDDCAFSTNPVYGQLDDVQYASFEAGLTIREYMATQIMAGFGLLDHDNAKAVTEVSRAKNRLPEEILAKMAVERTDALIAALNGKPNE